LKVFTEVAKVFTELAKFFDPKILENEIPEYFLNRVFYSISQNTSSNQLKGQ